MPENPLIHHGTSPIDRILEPEVMDTESEALTYDNMDHSTVNDQFVMDLIAAGYNGGDTLDLGTGTAQIPIRLVQQVPRARVMAVDLSVNMLNLARYNLEASNTTTQIQLAQVDAKAMNYSDEMFDAVISNSIVHHLPDPKPCLAEVVRVTRPGGLIFFRDLLRPQDRVTLNALVEQYCGNESATAQKLFADSLHAALTLEEIRHMVNQLGFPASSVVATSDRHWTWAAFKNS